MSVIKDAPTTSSIALPLSVELCYHPEGRHWQYSDGGTLVDLRLHLETEGDHEAFLEGAIEIVRRALAQAGRTAEGLAFVDIRYAGDLTRSFTLEDDDEYIGEELNRLLDRFYYKKRLYLDEQNAELNADPEMADRVRAALLGSPELA